LADPAIFVGFSAHFEELSTMSNVVEMLNSTVDDTNTFERTPEIV